MGLIVLILVLFVAYLIINLMIKNDLFKREMEIETERIKNKLEYEKMKSKMKLSYPEQQRLNFAQGKHWKR